MAAEGESSFELTTHGPTRAASAESLHSLKWKPALNPDVNYIVQHSKRLLWKMYEASDVCSIIRAGVSRTIK